ncbi:MAG: NAD(P)-dependent oxidoreductase [Ignavibacteriales bacterium]|nr:NAD(P)-dependent oxidoreductase [Ignavibacteriales bacterium]
MKILVTGGSGLVGRYVVDELAASHQVQNLDLKKPHRTDLPFHAVDLLNAAMVKQHVRGFDAVVHLAGIPHPLNDPPERVFRTNALGTFNLLEACASNGIRKVIFISSESVLGFAFSTSRIWPEYLQIDERHPNRPQDAYGLSKVTCEGLCLGFTRRTGMQTICLRPPWIWVPEANEITMYKQLRSEYQKWSKNLWAYIHVHDVARAVRQCVEAPDLPLHDAFFICAPETWTDIESRSLAAEYFPETKTISPSLSGNFSFISTEKAKNAFGFSPASTWRDIITG